MRQIALTFDLNEDWIGGSYYIQNLMYALGRLPEDEQPIITLISSEERSVDFIRETKYPKLEWVKAHEFTANPDQYGFDAIFPWSTPDQAYRTVSWIPDFQELHLPYYFAPDEIARRRHHHRQRFAGAGLVVSSEDVKSDVNRFYPGECPNTAVVRFATFNKFDDTRQQAVKEEYGLTGPYVMCANQVWVHKNHILVLKALAVLKERGVDVTVCFTGNESDYRVGNYSGFLKNLAKEWGIADRARFLGFIPRDDQLNLMKGADYIIQPSLFEGWSTVVEDAKAMGQYIVASDLGVHKEQLIQSGRLFPRHNPDALADIMQEFAQDPPAKNDPAVYEQAREDFGRNFIAAIDKFLPKT